VNDDPRERFQRALKRGLRCGPLKRRRVVREITAHLDDMVTDLEARGMPEAEAVEEALRRLGDVFTITSAFREVGAERRLWSETRWLRSPAWIAVGAMSLVTAWAAELPQASRAKATTQTLPLTPSGHPARPSDREHRRAGNRRLSVRAGHAGPR
jgi:hypothetical protein